jgi:2,4-dienoyl-CoA reductase-like NADH-dependent reductase (Old Yellow Enzyme family)
MSIGEVETIEATTTTPLLLQPIAFRGVTLRNRIVVSPMAMYSARDGKPLNSGIFRSRA